MRRWLPYPMLSAFLLGMWLLLNQTLAPGHVLLGMAIGIGGGLALTPLELPRAVVGRPRAIFRLVRLVVADMVRSNFAVGRIVLSPRREGQRSGFITVPLDLRDRYGLAVLACIVTSIPGTIWVRFDSARGDLMIHVLDLVDEAEWVRTVKQRYERLLIEIFE
jgi:multicomponent K+:H+ antiporter subunit E